MLIEKKTAMAIHPIQMVFLEEIRCQLKMYLNVMEYKVLDKGHEVYREKIRRTLGIIETVIESKKDISRAKFPPDAVYDLIADISEEKSGGKKLSR